MIAPHLTQLPASLKIDAWRDTRTELYGYKPRSDYVEAYWLPVLGPTATWLFRRFGMLLEASSGVTELDTIDLSMSLGLGSGRGRNCLLAKAIGRLIRFEVAKWDDDILLVRLAVPKLADFRARELSAFAYVFHKAS